MGYNVSMSKDSLTLEVSIGAGDIVHLAIGGNVAATKKPEFEKWIQDTQKTIKDLFEKKKGKVLCLVDISGLQEYHPEVLTDLAGMMKVNEPYVLRTATFGGNAYMTMAEDIVIALSGRKNLRAFNTRAEALVWLREGGEGKEVSVEM